MTRLFTDGGEFGDLKFWDTPPADTTCTTNKPASGAYSYENAAANWTYKNLPAALSEIYLRIRGWQPNGSQQISLTLRKDSTTIGSVQRNNTTGKIEIYVGASLVATSTNILEKQTWNVIEWHLNATDSGGTSEVRIDSIPFVSYSGDTKPGTDTTFNNFGFQGGNGGAPNYIDDIAANDINGSSDNSWCGPGRVERLAPTAEGYTNQWSVSTGSTHWSLVDEVPANTTDYIYSNTANQIDAFVATDWDSTDKTVKRVFIEVRAYDYGASAAQISLGFRTTEGTNYFSTTNNTLTGAYTRHVSDDFLINPATSTTWSDADIDALQILVKEIS